MVVAYIKKVQSENGGDAFTLGAVAADVVVIDSSKKVVIVTTPNHH
jgi:hypothetical protein